MADSDFYGWLFKTIQYKVDEKNIRLLQKLVKCKETANPEREYGIAYHILQIANI